MYFDGDLTVLCPEDFANNSNDVADIISEENFVFLRRDRVLSDVALNSALFILYINKGSFSHLTFGHDSSGTGYFLAFHLIKVILDIFAVVLHVPSLYQERVSAHVLKLFEFLASDLSEFVQTFFRNFNFCFRFVLRRHPAVVFCAHK